MNIPPLLHLLYYKVKVFLKFMSEWRLSTTVKNLGSAVVFGGFTIASYYFARATTFYLLDKAHLGVFLLHRFISMMLYVFFFSVNVGNIIVSYATLYRSPETAFLMTKPISHTSLFVIRFLDNFFYSSTTLFLIAVAVLLGYGSYFSLPWLFYVRAMVMLFIPFMLLAAVLAGIMLMFLINLATRIGVKTVLLGAGLGYVALVFSYFRATSPMDLVNSVMKYYPNVDQYYGFLEPSFVRYLPNQWVADALYWMVRGNLSHATPGIFLMLDATFLAIVTMLVLARRFYHTSWLQSLELRVRVETHGSGTGFMAFTQKPMFEQQRSVLFKKEFWQFFREPSQWIHFAIIVMLIAVFLSSIAQIQLRSNIPFLQTVSYLVVYVFNAFLVSSVALRFVYPMMSTEGRSFWSVLSAPVSRKKIYSTKILIAVIPVLLIALFLGLVSYYPLRGYRQVLELGVESAVCTTVALVSLNLGAGSFFADYSETNPIRVGSSQGATLTFLVSIVYLILLVAVLFFPLQGYFESLIQGKSFSLREMHNAVLIIGFSSLILAGVSSTVGVLSLKRDF